MAITFEARPPKANGYRFADLTGRRFGRLTVTRLLGFHSHFSAWECICDCGKVAQRLGAHLTHAARNPNSKRYQSLLHCGCRSKKRSHGLSGTYALHLWNRIRDDLCERWHDVPTFKAECVDKQDGRFLVRLDPSQPYSPGNCFWSDHTQAHHDTIQECIDALVDHFGMGEDAAVERAYSISRQRRFQLIFQANGLCASCGAKRERLAKLCNRCQRMLLDYRARRKKRARATA